MGALPRVQALSAAVGTWEHASLPCPARCQFGWAPFRMGALFSSRIRGGSRGRVSRQWLLRSGPGWNLNQGKGGENKVHIYSHLCASVLVLHLGKLRKGLIMSGLCTPAEK